MAGNVRGFAVRSDLLCNSHTLEVQMAIRITRNAGMLLLAIWLIVTGVGGFAPLRVPGVLMAALALIAGILILVGM